MINLTQIQLGVKKKNCSFKQKLQTHAYENNYGLSTFTRPT